MCKKKPAEVTIYGSSPNKGLMVVELLCVCVSGAPLSRWAHAFFSAVIEMIGYKGELFQRLPVLVHLGAFWSHLGFFSLCQIYQLK